MGEATGKALEKLKFKKFTLPRSFDDLGLLQAVLALPQVSQAPQVSQP
jgi:uroporphyrinogen-III synthase